MPFYEYQCSACGAQVEVLQKISDAPLKKCPTCGKSKLHKLVSAPVFRLKGGGWYETDFKGDKDNKRNLVDSDKGESATDTKVDAKSDAKADDKAGGKGEAKAESRTEGKTEGKAEGKAETTSGTRSAAKPSASAVRPAKRTAKKNAPKKAKR